MTTTLGVDGALTELVATVELSEGSRLARAGRYGEADAALSVARSTPAGLDLRARIAAQQRRYDEAGRLWREAAELLGDPNAFADELATIARLQRRRFAPAPFVVAALVLGGVLVGWAVTRRSPSGDGGTSQAQLREDVLASLEEQADESRDADEALIEQLEDLASNLPAAGETQAPEPGPLEDRLRALDDVEVTRDDEALHVRFDEPVFSEGSALTPTGRAGLVELAAALEPDAASHLVVVTGHTDGLPPRPGGPIPSNEELALLRARAGVAGLVAAGLPAEAVAVNVAAAQPPHPEGGEAGDSFQPRNRTITLTVYQRTSPASGQDTPG